MGSPHSPALPRLARRKHRRPVFASLALLSVTAASFTGIYAVAAPLIESQTPASQHPDQRGGLDQWIAHGQMPLTINGSFEGAELIITGDSRVRNAIHRRPIDEAGLGPCCTVWRGGADLNQLLDHLLDLPPKRVVVCLSPLSVRPMTNKLIDEIVKVRPPALDPRNATDRDVYEWAQAERERLTGLGFRPRVIEGDLMTFRRKHHSAREQLTRLPRAADAALELAVSRWRFRYVTPLRTVHWKLSWDAPYKPNRSNGGYRIHLKSKEYQEQYPGLADAVTEKLRRLATTTDVYAVRLPITPALRRVEDAHVPPARIEAIAREAGVPFRDYGTTPHSNDGSHLNVRGTREFTASLIDDLGALGWDRPDRYRQSPSIALPSPSPIK